MVCFLQIGNNHGSILLNSNATFSLNSNFSLTGMSQISHPNYNRPKPMQDTINNGNNLRNSTLSINSVVNPGGNSSKTNENTNGKHDIQRPLIKSKPSNQTALTPTNSTSLTLPTVPTIPTTNQGYMPPVSSSQKPQKLKKSDLAGSSASVVNSSVMGASSLLNKSMLKLPLPLTTTTTLSPVKSAFVTAAGLESTAPISLSTEGGSNLVAHSNYNVNIIPSEIERKHLTMSTSDNLIKDSHTKKKSGHHHHHHHHHHKEKQTFTEATASSGIAEAEAEESSKLIWQKRK